jgi:hypothetical protein
MVRQDVLVSELLQFDPSSPNDKIRADWAASLAGFLDVKGMTRKELVAALAERDVEVSVQAVGQWLRAETSPRPHVQGVIAAILQAPVRSVFPIEAA